MNNYVQSVEEFGTLLTFYVRDTFVSLNVLFLVWALVKPKAAIHNWTFEGSFSSVYPQVVEKIVPLFPDFHAGSMFLEADKGAHTSACVLIQVFHLLEILGVRNIDSTFQVW